MNTPLGSHNGHDVYLNDMKKIMAREGYKSPTEAMGATKGHLPYDTCHRMLESICEGFRVNNDH